jgi:hypothetical protein
MRKDRIFYIINEVNEELSLSNNPRQISNLLLNALTRVMNVDASWVRLEDAGSQTELLTVTRGLTSAQNLELQAPELRSVLDDRIGVGDTVIIPDISQDEVLGSTSFVKYGFGCLVVIPLATYQLRGVLGTMWRITKGFDADYTFLLMVIGNLACSALERAALYERLAGRSETESEAKYDIDEFEKLVALAERYSRATRMAIKEAVVRAKGNEGAAPPSLIVPAPEDLGEGTAPPLPAGESGPGNVKEERPSVLEPEPGPEAHEPRDREEEAGPEPGAIILASLPVRAAGDVDDGLARHEQRMKAFARLHPGHLKSAP